MTTLRLTMAQALVRFLAAQGTICDGREVPLFAGVWAIFGHGNVAGVGEALYRHRAALPTYRAHNEQAMAHAAIAFAKAHFRRRMMACTTSIGPGATNLITAAATAHVNRLPVLFLPGDVFVSRAPDPVLQQIEDFHDGGVSANDCFKPVSRYFDRIVAPSQLLTALPRAIAVLTDPAQCGPVTLALPQDVQAEAYDYPEAFFAPTLVRIRAPLPDPVELDAAAQLLRAAKQPVIVAGGGVLYSDGGRGSVAAVCRGASRAGHRDAGGQERAAMGPSAAGGPDRRHRRNGGEHARARRRSRARRRQPAVGFHHGLALAVRRRRRSSRSTSTISMRSNGARPPFTATPPRRSPRFPRASRDGASGTAWQEKAKREAEAWRTTVSAIVGVREARAVPIAVRRRSDRRGPALAPAFGVARHRRLRRRNAARPSCTSSGAPPRPGGYHMEYGYSCMGYEIAGGIGVKMAHPDREVVVMVGDGSYLMLNSEIATSVMLGTKLVIVVLDNRGYGCIHRLQRAVGGEGFNNLFDDCVQGEPGMPAIDFAAHARSLGALAEHVDSIAELEAALARARAADRTCVVVIDTDPLRTTEAGGWWWEVGVPEVSESDERARGAHRVRARQASAAPMMATIGRT